jgi:hypothetical protein
MTRPHLSRYSDPNPETIIGRIRTTLMQLYAEHKRSGMLPTNERFLYYELVSRGVISKTYEWGANRVSTALTELREKGLIPWDDIVDETRRISDFTGSATVLADWLLYLPSARINPWGADEVPFLICESRSLAGVLRPLARRYRVQITATNGQCGRGFLKDIAEELSESTPIGYLGDYDLAGNQIENNTETVLEEEICLGAGLQWERLAITQEQVRQHRLPTVMKMDRRYKPPRRHPAVETEALSQALIVQIVEDWLKRLLPKPPASRSR